jgi:prepilin peptidase CpaA
LLTLLSGAVFTDLYKDRIYNLWLIPGLLVGIITAALGGLESLLAAMTAIAFSFVILLPVYLFKGIAAGDVKLFMRQHPLCQCRTHFPASFYHS